MKNYKTLITIAFAILFTGGFTGCDDDDVYSEPGRVTFYNNQSNVGVITVSIGTASSQITQTKVATECSTSGCANFSITQGRSYTYAATATTGEYWSGTKTFTASCTTFRLQ